MTWHDAAAADNFVSSRYPASAGYRRRCYWQSAESFRCAASWRTRKYRYRGTLTVARADSGLADSVNAVLARTRRGCSRAGCTVTIRRRG